MLDLTRARRDMESWIYGALAQTTSVFARVLYANEAISYVEDPSHRHDTLFVLGHLGLRDSGRFLNLCRWPTNPHSSVWHPSTLPDHNEACLLDPNRPTDAALCDEVAGELSAPELCREPRCLVLTLACQPCCRMLIVRREPEQPFDNQTPQRAMRFIALADRIIQRAINLTLSAETQPHKPEWALRPNTQDVEQLLLQLSPTEKRVLKRLRQHETEKQVAEILERSPNTIHVHVKNIYRKLRVGNRRELLKLLNDYFPENEAGFHDNYPQARSA